MKHLSRFLLMALFVFGCTQMNAQNENNPWAVSLGINAVDYYPTGTSHMPNPSVHSETVFSEFFNYGDHYNIMPSVSKLSVAHYIGAGFSAEISGSINKIRKLGDMDAPGLAELTYYGTALTAKYSLGRLISPDSWFDPYVGVGAGYVWLDSDGQFTANGTLGFNFWFVDNFAITLQSTYKRANMKDDAPAGTIDQDHFQHSLGFTFVFGGTDSDGDGIFDDEDECPDTPGLEKFDGCPDTDGDGIQDSKDNCPNQAGLAEFNGCPDTDGDGVADPNDECPNVAGTLNGCPDADGDGVKDSADDCPDVAGPAANNGCPDSDGDGVIDTEDECPNEAGTVANNGCPEVTEKIIKHLNSYSKTILFDLNSSNIRESSYDALNSIVEIMKKYPKANFHIGGHTDSSGAASYNLKLSKERAASVRSYLVEHGIESDQITSEGYGEKYPVVPNTSQANRQKNRRVEVTLQENKPGSENYKN